MLSFGFFPCLCSCASAALILPKKDDIGFCAIFARDVLAVAIGLTTSCGIGVVGSLFGGDGGLPTNGVILHPVLSLGFLNMAQEFHLDERVAEVDFDRRQVWRN